MIASPTGPAVALCVLSAFAAPSLAMAHEVTHSTTLPPAPIGPLWGGYIPVPRFDPSLGELSEVRVQFLVEARGSARIENLGATALDVRGGCRASVSARTAGVSLGGPLVIATREFVDALAAFDGKRDFQGTSGRSHERLAASGTADLRFLPVDGAFAQFVGMGLVFLEFEAQGQITPTTTPRLVTDGQFSASLQLSVTYHFTPTGVIAAADTASTCPGTEVSIPVLANDSSTGGALDCTGVTVVTAPLHGTVQWMIDGSDCSASHFDYQPDPGFSGTDSFSYRVPQAGPGLQAATAEVQVVVAASPATGPDAVLMAACTGPSILIPVLENDAWEGQTLEIVEAPAHGSAIVELPGGLTAGSPCVRYAPSTGFIGQDTFQYRLGAGANGCPSAATMVSLQILGEVQAQSDDIQLCADQAASFLIQVLANDDLGGPPHPDQPVTITTPPALTAGTVTALTDGSVEFVPALGFRGTCAFEYRVSNTSGCADTTQATLHLGEAPLAVDDIHRALNDQPITLDVLANDVATGGGAIDGTTLAIVQAPTHGTVTVIDCEVPGNDSCRLVYTPSPGYVGPDQLRYSIASSGNCATEAQVDLDVQDPPVRPLTGGLPSHGSLLVFPEFDNTPGVYTLLTVTNTHSSEPILVEFVYINGDSAGCFEFNRVRPLTPNDTLTVLTSVDNPQFDRGYVYVFAKSAMNGAPVSFNHLIGNVVIATSFDAFTYSLNPFLFQALAAEGAPTNVDNDSIRDLNGIEYTSVADQVFVPRFLGQGQVGSSTFEGHLIVIPLTGGALFQSTVDFLIYNDNEQVFSGQRVFPCWSKRRLLDLSAAFSQDFLSQFTDHSPFEILGLPQVEAGWFSLDGLVANSNVTSIADPALLAVYVESVVGVESGRRSASDLPFVSATTQNNGDLLPRSVFGDTN